MSSTYQTDEHLERSPKSGLVYWFWRTHPGVLEAVPGASIGALEEAMTQLRLGEGQDSERGELFRPEPELQSGGGNIATHWRSHL